MCRTRPVLIAVAWMLMGVLSVVPLCSAKTLYVASGGNDAWSGSLRTPNADGTDGPLASVAAAVAAARRLDKGVQRHIVILEGEYFLDATMALDHRDSGLMITAAVPGHVTLYGGRVVDGWRREGPLWVASVPDAESGGWDFRALVVNGRLADRARFPETGTLQHESRFDVPWMSTTGGGWQRKPTQEELTTLKFRRDDLPAELEAANAEITVYHMWDESLVGVASIDRRQGLIRFSNPSGHPPGAFGVHKYVVWNTRCGLTREGQWYLDRATGRIVYWPRSEERLETTRVIAPTMESIVRIEGAEGITLEGLQLSVTNTPLRAGGFGAGAFDGAVHVRKSRQIHLRGLEVFNVAGQGLATDGSAVTIHGCHVHDTGACGIKAPSGHIENNHVHHVGRIYPSAIAIWGGGRGAVIAHNDVHDTPYTAINCGGRDHRIEHNRIWRAMLELHDGGAIYVFAGENTVLRGNMAFDIADTGGYGSSAYYLDERSTGCLVEGNLSYGVARPSHNHMAHGNTIRNNVFIYDGDMRLTFARCSDYTFEDNVLQASGSITFSGANVLTVMRNNLLDSGVDKVIGRTVEQYTETGDTPWDLASENVVGPARIEAYRDGRVRYQSGSPALERKIGRVDVHAAGVVSADRPR